jgi:hypothetical protein
MSTKHSSAIRRLVDHHGGPTKVAALIGEGIAYQNVQQWLQREWASPLHFPRLAPLLIDGMTVGDLYADIAANKAPRKSAKAAAAPAQAVQ